MKQFLIIIMVFAYSASIAQEIEEPNPIVQDLEETISIEQAQTQYNETLKALELNRAEKIKLENKINQDRISLRKARNLVLNNKQEELISAMETYEVVQFAVLEKMSKGKQSGYSVFIPTQDYKVGALSKIFDKTIDGEFQDYMKNYSVGKVKRKRGEIHFNNIIIPEIDTVPLTVYATIDKQDAGNTLTSYFYNGTDFLDFSQETNATANAKNILVHFAKAMHKINTEEKIDTYRKELSKVEKELEQEKKYLVKLRETISENEIETLESLQEISLKEQQIDEIISQIERTTAKMNRIDVN